MDLGGYLANRRQPPDPAKTKDQGSKDLISRRQRAPKAKVDVEARWSVVPIGGEHAGVRAIVPGATAEEGVANCVTSIILTGPVGRDDRVIGAGNLGFPIR